MARTIWEIDPSKNIQMESSNNMADPGSKLKSIMISVLGAVAGALDEGVRRREALRTLGIDPSSDKYEETIGKLAVAIVELQKASTPREIGFEEPRGTLDR